MVSFKRNVRLGECFYALHITSQAAFRQSRGIANLDKITGAVYIAASHHFASAPVLASGDRRLKKRSIIYLVLACYALTLCGNLWQTGCHHDDKELSASDHEAQVHVHSKIRVAAHGLLHAMACADQGLILPIHSCCVGDGDNELGMRPHTWTRQEIGQENPNSSSRYGLTGLSCMPPAYSRARAITVCSDFQTPLTLETVQATVLLI
jgi:hypothetical protein